METTEQKRVKIRTVFPEQRVVFFEEGLHRDDAMRELVGAIVEAGLLNGSSAEEVVRELIKRESAGTTGMGQGLALPHLRTAAVNEHAGAVGLAPGGLDFNSLDNAPTRLIFLLLSPLDAFAEHADIMRRLARLMSDHTLPYVLQVPRQPETLFRLLGF